LTDSGNWRCGDGGEPGEADGDWEAGKFWVLCSWYFVLGTLFLEGEETGYNPVTLSFGGATKGLENGIQSFSLNLFAGNGFSFFCVRETGRLGEMERWRDGEMERWRDGEMGRWRDGEMERWRDGEMERWRDGEMERWRDGEMERWRDGEMERWGDGEMGRWGGVNSSLYPGG
jgi:hypothetical protein